MKFWIVAILSAFSVSLIIRWVIHLVNAAINLGMDVVEKLYPCHKIGLEHHWVEYCPKNSCHCDCGQKCNECLRVCITCRTVEPSMAMRWQSVPTLTKEDWNNIIAASIHES